MSYNFRLSSERGFSDHGWLKSHFTFSFADYYDASHMGFRSLRVINEDYISGGMGFGEHPHRDMEIITYILEGTLAHKDSMGHQENIHVGDIQKMSAGSGVSHSEFNADPKATVHLFQIWILPNQRGIKPTYEQITLPKFFQDELRLVATDVKTPDTVFFQQDAKMYIGRFKAGNTHIHKIGLNRGIWFQMITGQVLVDGKELNKSDAVGIEEENELIIKVIKDAEFLLFDLM